MADHKRVSAFFYRRPNGREPVRDWLKNLIPEDKKAAGFSIRLVEYGFPLGMPTCKFIRDGIWEIRFALLKGTPARIYFGIDGEKIVLLAHTENKDRQDHDITVALERWRDYQRRTSGD